MARFRGLRLAQHRHHAAVVVWVCGVVQQLHSRLGPEGVHDALHLLQVPPLAEIGDGFDPFIQLHVSLLSLSWATGTPPSFTFLYYYSVFPSPWQGKNASPANFCPGTVAHPAPNPIYWTQTKEGGFLMLNVTMLQTPSVTLDGVPVSFPFKRADALLYYMLVRRSATRQELISAVGELRRGHRPEKSPQHLIYAEKRPWGATFSSPPEVPGGGEQRLGGGLRLRPLHPAGGFLRLPRPLPPGLRRQARLLLRRVAGPHPGEAPRAVSGPAGPAGPAALEAGDPEEAARLATSICGRTPLTSPWPPSSWEACGRPGSTPGPPRCTSG